ncbi:Adaptive-response sensory-kinase SasA [bioreactor metagenome]|uniref:histidine kinase n=1 Tax=bioreactor metagenome TaxID=1076179 RepID=A0A645IVT1_9ZZZZ
MQPQAVMVDLGELCMALHATLDPDVQGRVHMEIAPGKHAASLDPTLMQMALENLLDNALRYSPADGRVLFTLAAAKASPSNAGHIDITITDSGPGLPEAEMANLGMPYYRGSSSLGTQGTGLGYYFSRSIIEAHAGRVFVRLGQACGLQVQVRLPLFGQQTGL